MSKLPRVTGKEVVLALEKAGFVVVRNKGSHRFMRHADGRTTVVPVHAGDDVGTGLLLKILRDCDLTKEAFENLL